MSDQISGRAWRPSFFYRRAARWVERGTALIAAAGLVAPGLVAGVTVDALLFMLASAAAVAGWVFARVILLGIEIASDPEPGPGGGRGFTYGE